MTGLRPILDLAASAWLTLRTWGMCQHAADYDVVLRYAMRRANLERTAR